ncbi:tetratricopeptide repeat protein [Fonticella tunisiensis]|uniref:Tetratricopeptide repeat protein n=1 Tax=Fonticella tunisiensis TaxID=1096341 RepID=A0A4R7KAC5_9CLOT|nr:hypothetical protein [Fonticella tunisiensis]TDT50587.1 tetratricopeptide repeat protein [Fonticella tunisiensis]
MEYDELVLNLIRNSKYKHAKEMINKFFKDNLKKYHYYTGLCYYAEGNLPKSLIFFNLAKKYGLEHYLLYYNMAVTYMELWDFKNAEKAFTSSIRLNRNFKNSYINLAYIYYKNGDIKKAYRIMKSCISIIEDPELYSIEKFLLEFIKKVS